MKSSLQKRDINFSFYFSLVPKLPFTERKYSFVYDISPLKPQNITSKEYFYFYFVI